jgi:transcriptional regulator with XRE-family HTH domain
MREPLQRQESAREHGVDRAESGLLARNTRFLLWKQQIPRDQWGSWLEARLSWSATRIKQLVRGHLDDSRLGYEEVSELSGLFGMNADEQDLRYRDLVTERCDILRENLTYLIDSLERGGKKLLAEALSIDPTTVSRWLNGSFAPNKPTLISLSNYFGLPLGTDLTRDPIFLSADPIAEAEQRQWVATHLKDLSADEFRLLYPAFRRLLEDR